MALWHDALAQAPKERAMWPYDWVNGVDYPHKSERGNVIGQLVLDDPQAVTKKLPHLTVGLAHPDYLGNGSTICAAIGQRQLSRPGSTTGIITNSGPMAPTTANSPSTIFVPAPIRFMPSPTECWANSKRPKSSSRPEKISTLAN